jgi:excisionase family DNA binding protein
MQTLEVRPSPSQLLTPAEVAGLLRVGKTTTFALIGSGQIPSVQIGKLRRIRASAVDEYLSHLEGGEAG